MAFRTNPGLVQNPIENGQGTIARTQIDEAFVPHQEYKIPQYNGADDQCGLSNSFGTSVHGAFSPPAPEIALRFSEPSPGQHSFTSAELCPFLTSLVAPASSICPVAAHVDGPFDDTADGCLSDSSHCTASAQIDGHEDYHLSDNSRCLALALVGSLFDKAHTDSGHCPATVKIRGEDDDDLGDDSPAEEHLMAAKSLVDLERDNKELLSTNLARQASRSEERVCDVCLTETYYEMTLPIRQELDAYPYTHSPAENFFQSAPRNCIASLTIPKASHLRKYQRAALKARATPGPTAVRFSQDFPNSAEPTITTHVVASGTAVPVFLITIVSCVDSQPGICKVPTVDGQASTAQEPSCDKTTENGHESTMEGPACDVPILNGHGSTIQEPPDDVPTSNGHATTVQEPPRNEPTRDGHESIPEKLTEDGSAHIREEFTGHKRRVSWGFFKWLWGFVRKALSLTRIYEQIETVDSGDIMPGRQDSARSNSTHDNRGGIIYPLINILRRWFPPRNSLLEVSYAEAGVPLTVFNLHDGPSFAPNQSHAHQGVSETSPLMQDAPDGYLTFPTLSPPTPTFASSSQSSWHPEPTLEHQDGRGR